MNRRTPIDENASQTSPNKDPSRYCDPTPVSDRFAPVVRVSRDRYDPIVVVVVVVVVVVLRDVNNSTLLN
jgi:hypothetical protein